MASAGAVRNVTRLWELNNYRDSWSRQLEDGIKGDDMSYLAHASKVSPEMERNCDVT